MIRKSNVRPVRAALVGMLSLALLIGGASAAFAAGGSATKAKTTTVTVVVGDTQGLNGPMTMTVTPASAPAGKVKFTVKNHGTIIHEMVVLKTTTPFDQLPVANNKVSESKRAGEMGDIGKGKTKSKTLQAQGRQATCSCATSPSTTGSACVPVSPSRD